MVVESGATGPSSGSFSITLDCGNDGSLTFTPGIAGGTSSALGVPSGAACTLVEGDALGADQISGEITSAQTFTSSQTLTETNTYVTPTVDLVIEKVVVVESGATGPSGGSFSITLDCGNAGSLTFTPGIAGGTSSALGVPSGAACTLVEGDALGADQISGEITSAQAFTSSQTLTVTNTYQAPAAAPSIDIEKATNGQDADAQTGPPLTVGDAVTFSYVVTNTGNVALTGVTVSDDVLGAITCPQSTLAPGESMTCAATATVAEGQYANVGTATGTPPVGGDVTDSDPSHHLGVATTQPITITVTKIVVTNDGSAPEQGTEFSIEVLCSADGIVEFLTLANGDSATVSGITPGTGCEIFEVFGDGFSEPDQIVGEVTPARPFNVSEAVTITNIYGGASPPPPPPPSPITITVVKDVTTSGAGQSPDAATQFAFTLDCFGPDFSFSLADGESFQATMQQNTRCSLTETDRQGASDVSGEFSDQLLAGSQTFMVTNNYDADPPPEVLGSAIIKTLTSADPAAVGEEMVFDIAVTFQGDVMPNVELVDSYDRSVLRFVSASIGSAPLACEAFAAGGT